MNVQECWNVQHTGPSTLFENSEGKAIYASEVQVQNNSTICEYLYDCKCFIHSK